MCFLLKPLLLFTVTYIVGIILIAWIYYAMVACERKLFCNTFEIISVFCFTCNHRSWVTREIMHGNYFEIFQCFISHVTTSETEIKLFQPLKEVLNGYFKIISVTLNTLESIHELR